MQISPQGPHRLKIPTRRPPEPEVDTPGIHRFQRSKLFGHHQRRMIRQHHAAAAHANRLRRARHMSDQHRCRRTRQSFDRVVLRQPEALVTPALDVLRQIDRARDAGARRLPRVQTHQIQNRNR